MYFNLSNKVQIFGLPVSIQYQHTKCRDTTMYRFFPLYISWIYIGYTNGFCLIVFDSCGHFASAEL